MEPNCMDTVGTWILAMSRIVMIRPLLKMTIPTLMTMIASWTNATCTAWMVRWSMLWHQAGPMFHHAWKELFRQFMDSLLEPLDHWIKASFFWRQNYFKTFLIFYAHCPHGLSFRPRRLKLGKQHSGLGFRSVNQTVITSRLNWILEIERLWKRAKCVWHSSSPTIDAFQNWHVWHGSKEGKKAS